METYRILGTNRILVQVGCLLIFSGCLHFAIWFQSGESWDGPVSWRKPILFGVSGGITLISLGFLMRWLAPWRIDAWLAPSLSLTMALEVALITLQQWRGVASHFNRTTSLDRFIEAAITFLITLVSLGLLILAARTCLTKAPRDVSIAWGGGMFFLLLSCAVGFVIHAYGTQRVAIAQDPSIYGRSGVTKFPHGLAIHAIQLLPCLAWGMKRFSVSMRNRCKALLWTCASIGFILVYSMLQTLSGRDRWDIFPLSSIFLFLSLATAFPCITTLVQGVVRHFRVKQLAPYRVVT